MIDALTSAYRLHQLIQEPTHILNLSSSCIYLIFNSHLVIESEVNSCLHPNCHHQVVLAKFNLSILYSPPYERTVWFFKTGNPKLIRKPINEFDWISDLSNISIEEKVCYFTKTLLNAAYTLQYTDTMIL